MDSEENVRAKLRLLRTAHKKVEDALAREGAYMDEILGALMAIEVAVHVTEDLLNAFRS